MRLVAHDTWTHSTHWDVRGSDLETSDTTDLDQVCNIANQLALAVTVYTLTCITVWNIMNMIYDIIVHKHVSLIYVPPDHCEKPPALPLSTFSTTSWQTNTARYPCAAAKDCCGSSGHPGRVEADSQSRRETKEKLSWNRWKMMEVRVSTSPYSSIHYHSLIIMELFTYCSKAW